MAFSSPSNSPGSKQLVRFVGHARVRKLGAGMEPAFDEAAEKSCGGRAVEAMIVI
jgi:hypothetical protein